jgi:protein TonB
MAHRRSVVIAVVTVCAIAAEASRSFAAEPPRLADWVAATARADTTWVHRLGMRLVPRQDPDAAGRRWWSPYMVANEHAASGWSQRFVKMLADSLAYYPEGRCAPQDTTARPSDDLVVGIDFGTCDSCAFAVCYFHEGCVRLATRRGPAGAMSFERAGARRALLGLLREALPKDEALRVVAEAASDSPGSGKSWNDPPPPEYVLAEEAPVPVHKVPPIYPDDARNARVQGTVIVKALVGVDGLVKQTAVQYSIPLLDGAAQEAVRQWEFKPATAGRKPVAVWVTVPVKFTLH